MTWMQFRLIATGMYIIMKCVSAKTKEDRKAIDNWCREVKKETEVEL
jgi:hypothetical protein